MLNLKSTRLKIALRLAIIITAVFLFGNIVIAQGNVDPFGGKKVELENQLGLGNYDPRVTAAKIIRYALGFLGIIAIGLTIYGGFIWMTSGGNEQKIEQAKKILQNGAIGLIIILAAFGITTFILNKLLEISGPGGPGGSNPPSGKGKLTALGNGIVQAHYPGRNATNVPRNTKIVVTFREPMMVGDIVNGANVNAANILIYKSIDEEDGPYVTDTIAVTASSTADNRTFVFRPSEPIGSPSENIWYTVALSKNIRKANGQAAFGNSAGTIGYSWPFEVSTLIDLRPPQIESVLPKPSTTEPRNVVIQINFDEAVDPIAVSGNVASGFDRIVVSNGPAPLDGNFYISNQYRTVEFLTNDECGTNSCGETIYCLPGLANLSVLIKADSLEMTGQPGGIFPYDGALDMANNSFDGNHDGVAQGPETPTSPYFGSGQPPYNENAPDAAIQGDDFIWSFATDNTIDLTAPRIESISPGINQSNVDRNQDVEAGFTKYLMSYSLDSSISIGGTDAFWIAKDNAGTSTIAIIKHDPFEINTAYSPEYTSGIRDLYQNCYVPCSGLGLTGTPSCCNGVPTAGGSCP